jgi:dTDP-4-dehydrorhamnose 3,5-epimerase
MLNLPFEQREFLNMTSNPSLASVPNPSKRSSWRFTPFGLPDVVVIEPPAFGDARGWFSETYSARIFADHGIDLRFVQDNTSFSAEIGTVRGLHYQLPPFAQDKLVRVVQGCILDVFVDIRINSPAYGKHAAVELSAENGRQVLVPAGFAHGFVTREANTLVTYKVSNFYAPDHDRGIFWADPALGIDWGVKEADATLSAKDKTLPQFRDAEIPGVI